MSHVSQLILGKGDTLQRVPIHCDDQGNLYVKVLAGGGVSSAPLNSVSTIQQVSRVIKATPGVLFSLRVSNQTGGDVFLQLFDAAAVPGAGAVPVDYAVIPANWDGGLDYGDLGRGFATGIVAAISTTQATLTIAVGNNYLFSARYN